MDISTIQRELAGQALYSGPFHGIHDARTDNVIEYSLHPGRRTFARGRS